jgi:hypothetical protein
MGFVLYGSDGKPRAAFCYPDRTKAERAAKGFAAILLALEVALPDLARLPTEPYGSYGRRRHVRGCDRHV